MITFLLRGCNGLKNSTRRGANVMKSLVPRIYAGAVGNETCMEGSGGWGRLRRSLRAADEWAAMSHQIDASAARLRAAPNPQHRFAPFFT